MRSWMLAISMLAALPLPAAIETVETPSSAGTVRQWWPKITPPKGWVHDREHSVAYGINAMVPEGQAFGEAETVMYAKALYRPREPRLRDVEMLAERDKRKAATQQPPRKATNAPALKTGDGKSMRTIAYVPAKGEGNWERVAYLQEGNYFILFAVSSRTKKGYDAARGAFERMVRGYKEAS